MATDNSTESLRQSIGMQGIGNARELGGYPAADGRRVRKGVLLRTAKLSTATGDDLRRLDEEFRVAKVIDLRSDEEISGAPEVTMVTGVPGPEPDPLPRGAEYFHLSVMDMQELMAEMSSLRGGADLITALSTLTESGIFGDKLYYVFLDRALGKASYSRMFRELISLEEGRAMLFHCTQGKDRTGVAAMLILSALGVSEDIIVEDYMLTNLFNSERIAAERMMLERSGKVPPEKIELCLMAMDRVSENVMTGLLAHVKEKYGSVMNYITGELGVTDGELAELRNKLLE